VQAEARRRFELFLEAPATLDAATRRSVLRVVAAGADAPTWERLQALARAARSQLERAELYGLLAAPQDEALVQRALALALGEEVPATLRPALLSAAAQEHADLALGFALDHWDRVRGWIEPSNWPRFVPRLAQQGIDPVLIVRLDAFAGQSIPEAARRDLRKAEARIRYSATVRQARLPDCDRWLAAARSEPMRVSAR